MCAPECSRLGAPRAWALLVRISARLLILAVPSRVRADQLRTCNIASLAELAAWPRLRSLLGANIGTSGTYVDQASDDDVLRADVPNRGKLRHQKRSVWRISSGVDSGWRFRQPLWEHREHRPCTHSVHWVAHVDCGRNKRSHILTALACHFSEGVRSSAPWPIERRGRLMHSLACPVARNTGR